MNYIICTFQNYKTSRLELNSPDNLKIAIEDDDHRENEAKEVDVKDVCHVHPWILSRTSPLDTTTGKYLQNVQNVKFLLICLHNLA